MQRFDPVNCSEKKTGKIPKSALTDTMGSAIVRRLAEQLPPVHAGWKKAKEVA